MSSVIKVDAIQNQSGTAALSIASNGRITKAHIPSFFAVKNANLAESNGSVEIGDWTADFNIGNHFNASNGRFTCPVTGLYSFTFNAMHGNPSGDWQLHGKKNASTNIIKANQTATGASWNQTTLSLVQQFNANDTMSFFLYSTASSTYGIYGGNTSRFTTFCGHLIG
tara:strand:+ start:620 stop:1123 length:504 start_codon:yes stop_codon:yes gene_type:complete